ncbi:uncharacterized protein LOC130644590 isoform X2 [Hydractinia symbiolongicarpus]|nr:uncharacterized protein LOC130644590 isoform X2 [Hydractinia symbiolongicarpus]
MTTFILMIFILYFSTSFYCWCFAWSLNTVSLARYHMNMSDTNTFKTRVISIACYVIPVLFTVTCTLIGYYTNDKELRLNTVYHTQSKWILVSFEIMVILGKLSLIGYTFKKRIVVLARLNFTGQEILNRVLQTNALRNGSIFQVLLLITIVLDVITVARDEVFLPNLYAYITAQTIMAVHLLTLVTLLHDKNFRKPFRYQRQKKILENRRFRRRSSKKQNERSKNISVIYKPNLEENNHNIVIYNTTSKL